MYRLTPRMIQRFEREMSLRPSMDWQVTTHVRKYYNKLWNSSQSNRGWKQYVSK